MQWYVANGPFHSDLSHTPSIKVVLKTPAFHFQQHLRRKSSSKSTQNSAVVLKLYVRKAQDVSMTVVEQWYFNKQWPNWIDQPIADETWGDKMLISFGFSKCRGAVGLENAWWNALFKVRLALGWNPNEGGIVAGVAERGWDTGNWRRNITGFCWKMVLEKHFDKIKLPTINDNRSIDPPFFSTN